MRISDWSSDVCSSDLCSAGDGVPSDAGSIPATSTNAKGHPRGWPFFGSLRSLPYRSLFLYERTGTKVISTRRFSARPGSVWLLAIGRDRQSVVRGTSGAVRVDLGGRRIIKKKQ